MIAAKQGLAPTGPASAVDESIHACSPPATGHRRKIALQLTDLNGGGVQKMTMSLAGAFA